MDGADISDALIDCNTEANGGVVALLEEIERNRCGWTLVWLGLGSVNRYSLVDRPSWMGGRMGNRATLKLPNSIT